MTPCLIWQGGFCGGCLRYLVAQEEKQGDRGDRPPTGEGARGSETKGNTEASEALASPRARAPGAPKIKIFKSKTSSLLAQEYQGIDGQSALRGDPGCEQS
jgi:hypothetical protein